MGVTISGLAILRTEPKLAEYYQAQVITGPGAFVMEVRDFRAFVDAIVRKLEQETAQAFDLDWSAPDALMGRASRAVQAFVSSS
jgi:Protein of unknown function (DUF1194)